MNDHSEQKRWTAEAVRALGLHTTVETAADILAISRSAANDLIRRDAFPVQVLRLGRRLVIPVSPLLRALGADEAAPR